MFNEDNFMEKYINEEAPSDITGFNMFSDCLLRFDVFSLDFESVVKKL